VSFKGEIVLMNIDHIDVFEFNLILGDSFDTIFHKHLPIDLVHNHNPGIMHFILVRHKLLAKQVIIDPILIVTGIMIDVFAQLI
jgi:hypothetical protein